jgi:hypothetical protein
MTTTHMTAPATHEQHPALPLHPLAGVLSSLTVQLTFLTVAVGVLLWIVLFSGYPAAHDALHAVRHGLYAVPCH